jgi:hypothetical protein
VLCCCGGKSRKGGVGEGGERDCEVGSNGGGKTVCKWWGGILRRDILCERYKGHLGIWEPYYCDCFVQMISLYFANSEPTPVSSFNLKEFHAPRF